VLMREVQSEKVTVYMFRWELFLRHANAFFTWITGKSVLWQVSLGQLQPREMPREHERNGTSSRYRAQAEFYWPSPPIFPFNKQGLLNTETPSMWVLREVVGANNSTRTTHSAQASTNIHTSSTSKQDSSHHSLSFAASTGCACPA
jgi:hypothetical protein